MTTLIAIGVYILAFLILVLYTTDAVVQWRNVQMRSCAYFSIQAIFVLCIFIVEAALVAYNEQRDEPEILQGLHAVSLQALMSLRLCLGRESLLDFRGSDSRRRARRRLLWVYFFLLILAGLASFWIGITFSLQGNHKEASLILVAVAAIIAHSFPACFSLHRLHEGNALTTSTVSSLILGINLALLPASVATLLLPGVAEVLLGQTIVSCASNSLLVCLTVYNFEIKHGPVTTIPARSADKWSKVPAKLARAIEQLIQYLTVIRCTPMRR